VKILFTRFPLESAPGGAESQTLTLMEGFLAHGHAVAFLGSCPVLLKECKERGIPCAELEIGPPPVTKWGAVSFLWRRARMRRALEALFREFRDIDAVFMLSLSEKLLLTPLLTGECIYNVYTRPIPVFWMEHDRVGRWLTQNPWLPALRRLSNHATTVVVSGLSKKMYVDLGWDPLKVVTIPNGVPAPSPTPQKKHSETLRIGCVARLTPDKGVDLLVEAVEHVPHAHLTIVGKGRGSKRIDRMLSPLGSRVVRKEWVEDLSGFYADIDLFVLPSREHDPFGLVVAEAMLRGVPVLVTNVCGIAEYLTSGMDGIVVPAGESRAIEKEILKCLSFPKKLKGMGELGRRTAQNLFTAERMVDTYEKLLSSHNKS